MSKFLRFALLLFLAGSALGKGAGTLPQRIASGTVGSDEIIFELLGKEEALRRVVAVSLFSDDPKYSFLAPIAPSLKGRVGNSLEALLALKPDLAILASYNREELPKQLESAGVKVVVLDQFRSVDDIESNILRMGQLIGAEPAAQKLVARVQNEIKTATAGQGTCRPMLLQYASNDVVPGTETIFNNAVHRAGFQNAVGAMKLKGWAQISHEVLVQMQPDAIVVSKADAPDEAAFKKKMLSAPAWNRIPAVKDSRYIFVPDRLLYTVSHHIGALIGELAKHHSCPRKPT